MTDAWTRLANEVGRRAVMSRTISERQLDDETKRQAAVIFPLIAEQLTGKERSAIDFGCGSGRFSGYLQGLLSPDHRYVMGYDPCQALLNEAPEGLGVVFHCANPENLFLFHPCTFDICFSFNVLGGPDVNVEDMARGMINITSPGGLIIIAEHCEVTPITAARWWRYRKEEWYRNLFGALGIRLEVLCRDRQLNNSVTLFAGRKPKHEG